MEKENQFIGIIFGLVGRLIKERHEEANVLDLRDANQRVERINRVACEAELTKLLVKMHVYAKEIGLDLSPHID